MKSNTTTGAPQGTRRCLNPRSDSGYDSRIHGQTEPPEPDRPAPPEIPPDQWALVTVLDRLKGCRPCGDGYAARCPAHADWNPSLSVGETDEGHVLMKCHSRCSIEEILEAMGLKKAHLFTSEYARRFGRRRVGRADPVRAGRPRAGAPVIDHEKFEKVTADARVEDDEAFMPLCRATGLCVRACVEFGLGVEGSRYVFPERDDRLRPVGVAYRRLDGKKTCHKGSTRGLTIPVVERGFGGELYVAEGATDAMALHQVRVRAIGRPAAVPSALVFDWLAKYLARHAADGVVVLGDNDPRDEKGRRVGRDAARELAEGLAGALPGGIPVSWALPRKGYKDVREHRLRPAEARRPVRRGPPVRRVEGDRGPRRCGTPAGRHRHPAGRITEDRTRPAGAGRRPRGRGAGHSGGPRGSAREERPPRVTRGLTTDDDLVWCRARHRTSRPEAIPVRPTGDHFR